MRKTTKIIIATGGGFSGVGGLLLAIYLDDAKRFLDDLLSRIFGIPKSMVGYNVVTVVITAFLVYATLSGTYFLTAGLLNWYDRRKHPIQEAPPVIPSTEVEQDRKEAIWMAIKKWVELPITRFRDKQDVLPLAEKAPDYADEINECLSRHYPLLWTNLQKLRQDYHDWKSADSAARFTRIDEGRTVINIDYARKWDELRIRELLQLHSQLAEQIKSEILAKYHTRLKC
jgi:hypothetical protein